MFPQLFHLGGFAIPTYGVMAAMGLIAGLTVVVRGARLQGIDPEKAWNLGLVAILSAIIGAKVLMIFVEWDTYRHLSNIFSLQFLQAGGVFYGGLIAAIACCVWYMRRHRMAVLRTCDVFAPGIALGHAFGRIGCFSAGCCYGKETHVPWAVTFHNPLANYLVGTPLNVPLHPTQLYEFAVELLNFVLLWWLLKRKKFDHPSTPKSGALGTPFEGQVIGTYLFSYGVARFFLEFLRGDPGRGEMFGGALTVTQFISILLVICGGVLWYRRRPLRRVAEATA